MKSKKSVITYFLIILIITITSFYLGYSIDKPTSSVPVSVKTESNLHAALNDANQIQAPKYIDRNGGKKSELSNKEPEQFSFANNNDSMDKSDFSNEAEEERIDELLGPTVHPNELPDQDSAIDEYNSEENQYLLDDERYVMENEGIPAEDIEHMHPLSMEAENVEETNAASEITDYQRSDDLYVSLIEAGVKIEDIDAMMDDLFLHEDTIDTDSAQEPMDGN